MFNGDELMMNMLMMKYQSKRVFRSPARNEPRSGLLQMSGGRLFPSFVVLGKKEYL